MNEFNQIVENASDNEEAKGSSRTPTLNVFREKEPINVAILTVNYFGGMKLDIGRMLRTYSSATKKAIAVASTCAYHLMMCCVKRRA